MHGIEEGLLDKGCAEASDLLYIIRQAHNKRLKRDCQRVAFPVPLSRSGYGCCV